MITTHLLTSLGLATALCACVDGAATDTTSAAVELKSPANLCPTGTPAALAPAADQTIAFHLDAQGVQRYACVASTTGYAWTFIAPGADLFRSGGEHGFSVHHFAGPTWLAEDSSSIRGAKVAGATVDPTAIPWLLLNVVSHGGEPGVMSGISSIQRLSTTGGNAPATGCDADHVGANVDVLYTARYFFYTTNADHPEHNVRCGG